MRWLAAILGFLVGAFVGGAVGLFGPVFLFAALDIGSGSYEDVMFIWLVAVPVGALGGGAALLGLALWLQSRASR